LGNKLYTSQLQTEDFTILHPDNTVVCQVRTSRASMQLEIDELDETTEGTEEGAESTEGGETPEAATEN
jgi:large subunit ribosomal protein L25